MQIKHYKTSTGNKPVEEFLDSVSPEVAGKFFDALELLEAGKTLAMPISKMPWETLDLQELAAQLGVNYSEVKAKHELIEKIKAVRTKHNLTQEDLGSMLGKTQSWIAKVESGVGTKSVSFEALFKILAALGYDYKISTKKISEPEIDAA